MHRAPATAPPRVRENRQRYDQLVGIVDRRSRDGDLEGTLRSATVAANFAWRAPTGLINDPDLERMVVGAARGDARPPHLRPAGSGRVLHVLSEAYTVGGHTRLAWRWMERDGRACDVALTNQGIPVPPALQRAVAAADGRLFDLRSAYPTFAGRMEALRRLMTAADTVVYHVHPYDAVALAAASLPGPRPPILYVNHADFAYWLGLGCTEVVADFREGGRRLCRELRGVPTDRLGLLPLPMSDDPVDPAAGPQLRRKLGLRPEDVVAVAVASEQKMAPVWGKGFDTLVARALSEHPRLKIVLAGPAAEGGWASLAARFRGRLIVAGAVPDPEPFYAAADIYLNPYPVPGGTSVLEAAIAGVPVLSLQDMTERDGHVQVFPADSPGLVDLRHAAATEEDYFSRLRKLVRDPALRTERGAAARAAVLAAHAGPGWTRSLEQLYRQAAEAEIADLSEHPARVEDPHYGAMLLAFVSPGDARFELSSAAAPLGPQLDERLSYDLFAAENHHLGPSLAVRVSRGWENHPAWLMRLLALATRYPRLSVSLPFAAGDDAQGSRSVRELTAVLAVNGDTVTDCGDISLDSVAPASSGPAVTGDLPLTTDALDKLETLLSSPFWVDAASPAGEPVAAGALAG
jgi:glycosyltransferase involved in cell wall biosynthesis